MYIGTLTLALFLAVFGAVLLAVVLGNQLARPCWCWQTACARWRRATWRPRPRCPRATMNWAA